MTHLSSSIVLVAKPKCLFNLTKYLNKIKQSTIVWNVPYGLALGEKRKQQGPLYNWPKGTFFKIEANVKAGNRKSQ